MSLYQYDQSRFLDLESSEDRKHWGEIYQLIGYSTPLCDRTGFIKMPYQMEVMPELKIPYGPGIDLQSCADARVTDLLECQDRLNVPICVYYSGGIDSSYVLSSFLQRLSSSEAADRLVVAMTPDSIHENPTLYQNFIRGKLKTVPGDDFSTCLDLKKITISGELGDQIFGSDLMLKAFSLFGESDPFEAHYAEKTIKLFTAASMSHASANKWIRAVSSSAQAFGFEIKSLYDFLWWYNFSCKWQGVFLRMMSYSVRELRHNAQKSLDDGYYQNFFVSSEYQRWSINNHHLGIKLNRQLSWPGYKYPLKQDIFKLTGDQYYLDNKLKAGSLWRCVRNKFHSKAITSDLQMLDDLDSASFYQPHNTFV